MIFLSHSRLNNENAKNICILNFTYLDNIPVKKSYNNNVFNSNTVTVSLFR